MKRPRVDADYAAVADGRHLYLVGAVEGPPENGCTTSVVLRQRGGRSREVAYPVSSQRSEEGRLRFSATVPLEDGDDVVNGWRSVLLEVRSSLFPVQKLPVYATFDPPVEVGPTSSNPPSRQSGRLHQLRFSRGRPLRVKTTSTQEAVMVTAVNPMITRLEVEFELVGTHAASPDPSRDYAELRRRDWKLVTVRMPLVPLADKRWRIEVPIQDVVGLSGASSVWDFRLIRRKAGLRIGLELSDLRNPGKAFVYPFVPVTAGGHSWRLVPYYTKLRTLALSARWIDV